jgi:hypothetical protein
MKNPILISEQRMLNIVRIALPLLLCASVGPGLSLARAQSGDTGYGTCADGSQKSPGEDCRARLCNSGWAQAHGLGSQCPGNSSTRSSYGGNRNPVATPSGPSPEELRKEEEDRAAAAEAERKAAFIRDRDATPLRDANSGGTSDTIRDAADGNSSGGGIRETPTTPALDELRSIAGSNVAAKNAVIIGGNVNNDKAKHDAACGFGAPHCSLGGHIPIPLGAKPTQRTVELLSHIPDNRRDDPKVVNLLVEFQGADRDRLNKASYLNVVRKELAAGTGDAAALTQKTEELKTGIQKDAGTEKQAKEQLHEDLSAVWIEETQAPASKTP